MTSANDNRRRQRYVITVDRWDDGGGLEGVHLVAIYRGEPKGEPEYCEMIESPACAFAYAHSMARHLRCPIHDCTREAS
jgi:hypothetical protein